MIELLNWFAADRDRTIGFIGVFLVMCYGLSMIAGELRGKDK